VSVDALRAYVEELLAVRGLPGVSLAITDREGLASTETFGHANLDAGTPVSRETYFEIGSIGKTFTAVVLLQLREEGLVDLNEPVARYLPWFEVRSEYEPITLHHLLTHTGGVITGDALSGDSRFDVWALRETETGFPPGARFHYSNVGYRALGYVIEELTGKPYADVLQERILEPLDLRATDPALTNETRRRLAVGYERWYDDRPPRRSDPWVPAPWVDTATGDGSLASTAEDLAGFLRALLNRGGGVLATESFGLLAQPVIESGDGWSYGYGLEVREIDGRPQLRHGGSMPGFGSTMLGDLNAGLGVAVLVNGTDEGDLTHEVAAAALALHRDGASPPPPADPLVSERASEYEGTFVADDRRLALRADGERLLLASADRVVLEPRGEDRFFVDHLDFARFLLRFRRQDGSVVQATHGSTVYTREGSAERLDPKPPREWLAYAGNYRAYNPWLPTFRAVLQGDELILDWPSWGPFDELTPLENGSFRVGAEEWSPERVRFDAIVDGKALRANLAGCGEYYRLP
jgi:CubicO group peptidase (beta-lactamase class C family)